jgi:hypothetical protein
MKRYSFTLLLFFSFCCETALAQHFKPEDTEFKDTGIILVHLRFNNGLVTNFKSAPDFYAGSVQLALFWMPKPFVHVARIGVIADGFYTAKKLEAAFGPTISLKIKTLTDSLGRFGSFGNIHLTFDHLWGTDQYKLLGGGIIFESDFLSLGLTSHRDYEHKTWWFQMLIGIRLNKKPKDADVNAMPHNPN